MSVEYSDVVAADKNMGVSIVGSGSQASHHHALNFTLLAADGRFITLPKPCIMGVVNRSTDSFFSPYACLGTAIDAAADMVMAGASIIDVGAEATNPQVNLLPGKASTEQELSCLVPLVKQLKQRFPVLVSVDTSNPEVMQACIEAGADIINDQRALRRPGALEVVAKLKTPICLMHFFDPPRQPNNDKSVDHVVLLQAIQQELLTAVNRCLAAGIDARRIIIDPGFGQGNYGKSCAENFYLLAYLHKFVNLGYPVLVGWSRKSMIGEILGGVSPSGRLYGSLAAATIAAMRGAAIIRVHDVAASMDTIKVARATLLQVGPGF